MINMSTYMRYIRNLRRFIICVKRCLHSSEQSVSVSGMAFPQI